VRTKDVGRLLTKIVLEKEKTRKKNDVRKKMTIEEKKESAVI